MSTVSKQKPLAGRVALITGASSGIGAATAHTLARAGAKIVIVARRREMLEALADACRNEGAEVLSITADLLIEEENRRIVDASVAHFGRVDILINNAGVMLLSTIDAADAEDWRRMLELNVMALMVSSQAALVDMRARKDGHIVNISSTAGRVANPGASAYAVTKFGVVAFTESMRREVYKDKVRVTVIEPGLVATELRDHITNPVAKEAVEVWAASLRQLQAEDVANAVLYAVSQPAHVCINEILMRPTDQER